MTRHRFEIEGRVEALPQASSPLLGSGPSDLRNTLLLAVDLDTGTRAGPVPVIESPPLADTDLVEIALAEGGHLWMSVRDLRESGRVELRTARAGSLPRIGTRLVVPATLRGVGDWAIRALRFFRIDAVGELADAGERRIVEHIESALGTEPGLYRLDDEAATPVFVPVRRGAGFDAQPYLLFVHGTNSSTEGSFGDLWTHDGGSPIRALRARYGKGHLLALQHRSLSESPVENALQVAKAIPANTRLDLLTHSRGGLVGELLARATVAADEVPFTAEEIADYRAGTSAAAARRLQELGDLLDERRYTIERFVRVACPARGTTLASGKLERYCNVLLNLVDARLVAGVGGVAGALFALLKASVRDLVDFEDLPGLAAMNPGSALVKLLNGGGRRVAADLAVIAGDTEGGTAAKRIGMLLVDAFFDRDNDLVVDTISMRGGALRTSQIHQHLQRTAEIHHLAYFRNATALERMLRALCEPDPLRRHAGFDVVDVEQASLARATVPLRPVSRSGNPTPPIVFVLPGIMGTHLAVRRKRVWLNYPRLVFGAFGKLKISSREVEPDGLDGDTYADLVEFLSRSHEVVPFGYDWRLPVEDAARRFNVALRDKLATIDPLRQPIRIVAHSMGGLVARAMMMLDDSAWPAVCAHREARLLMLGTPNAGSHSITQLLFGEEKLVRMLAAFDLGHDLDDLIAQIAEFPGALDMLPQSSVRSYFDVAVWTDLAQRAMPAKWPLPTANELARAQAWRARLARHVLDPERAFYVAGQADDTPEEIELEQHGTRQRLRFRITPAGDGRVPWDGGIPPNLKSWFTNARHGDLAAHAGAHAGYLEILETGDTGSTGLRRDRPPTTSRSLPRDAGGGFVDECLPPVGEVASLPTRDELARAASGRQAQAPQAGVKQAPLPIRVAWGDLRRARHPVMVGHYTGDSIISAEAAIDKALGGRLGQQHRLGNYPGEPGTALAIVDGEARPRGVVVIGLGQIGRLTPGDLGAAVARGVVEWIGAREEVRQRNTTDTPAAAGLSLLLIGAGEGGVDADSAVFSILRGVREGIERGHRAGVAATLAEIEFVELYKDRAHRLWHTLDHLLRNGDLRERFVLAGLLHAIGDGRTRIWEAAPGGWWRRLQIGLRRGGGSDAPGSAELAFTSLTDSARSETHYLAYQADIVGRLVEQSIADTGRDEAREKTLFELILPNAIKERAPQRESLVLLLDRDTANLPWELLSDPLEQGAPAETRAKPLAVRSGLVRQFATAQFRQRPSVVLENSALVIGDPRAPSASFAELPGAQREARAVAEALRANARFQVEHLHRPDGSTVVQALLPRRYRILHVAGHGMLADSGVDRDSGIVLDHFNLSWSSLDQMRAVPELVFVNCCHLGRVADGEVDLALAARNRFAAGVGETFIRNGARAVIAAGWAVEDRGAEVFARMFYERMLAGERFGNSVRIAREAAYDAQPRSNTWGAYQCYGDPDYRLVTTTASVTGDEGLPRHASIEELVTEAIDTMAGGDLDAPARERVRRQIAQLGAIAPKLDPLQEARLQLGLARAAARARLHVEAIAGYARALDLDAGSLSLRDLLDQAGQYIGQAIERAGTAEGPAGRRRGEVERALADGLARYANLVAINPVRETLVQHADASQHAALLRSGAARRRALQAAQHGFAAAATLESPDHRQIVDAEHAALLALLIAWRAGKPTRAALARIGEGLAAAGGKREHEAAPTIERYLIEALLGGRLDPKTRKALAAAARARRRGEARIDSLDFTIAMLADAGSPSAKALLAALRGVREDVASAAGTAA